MVSVFYIAAIISIIASLKVVSGKDAMASLIYFIVSLLSTAVIFFIMDSYFSAALVVILFIGAVSLLFLSTLSILNIRKDVIEQNKYGISPKIWLGPFILVFVLFVIMIYCVVTTDYSLLQAGSDTNETITQMLLGGYILVAELAILMLLSALVIAYHFIHYIYPNSDNFASLAIKSPSKLKRRKYSYSPKQEETL